METIGDSSTTVPIFAIEPTERVSLHTWMHNRFYLNY